MVSSPDRRHPPAYALNIARRKRRKRLAVPRLAAIRVAV
jgi:hypothetical protein